MAIAVIALIAIVFFMIVSPGFRAFIFVAFLLLAGAFYWLVDSGARQSEEQRRREAARQALSKQIPDSDIRLSDATLDRVDTFGNTEEMTISGNVTNKSSRQLSSLVLTFEVTIRDCPSEGASDCPIVGQRQTNSYGLSLPSGQMRAFSTSIMKFDHLPYNPKHRERLWNVINIRAIPDAD
jgi:hypothetical protein